MNRTVWIARIAAIVILLIFVIAMTRLHSRLTALQRQQPAPAATAR